MSLTEILAEAESVHVLRPKPGDILVLRHTGRISEAAFDRLRGDWQRVLEEAGVRDVKVVILEEGASLEIVRQESEQL